GPDARQATPQDRHRPDARRRGESDAAARRRAGEDAAHRPGGMAAVAHRDGFEGVDHAVDLLTAHMAEIFGRQFVHEARRRTEAPAIGAVAHVEGGALVGGPDGTLRHGAAPRRFTLKSIRSPQYAV